MLWLICLVIVGGRTDKGIFGCLFFCSYHVGSSEAELTLILDDPWGKNFFRKPSAS